MAADALRSVICSNASLIAHHPSPSLPFRSRHSATLHQIFLSPPTIPFISCSDGPPVRPCTSPLFLLPSIMGGRDVIRAKGTYDQPASLLLGIRIPLVPHPSPVFTPMFSGKSNMVRNVAVSAVEDTKKIQYDCALATLFRIKSMQELSKSSRQIR